MYWAHRVADRFPDGQLYVNLRGFDPTGHAMDPAEAVRGFLDALEVPAERIPAELDAQAALYRSHIAGRRMLIVLDNAHDTTQVRPLLPGTAGCLVLITSRNQLSGLVCAAGAHPIPVGLLTLDEARELLIHRLGPNRISAEPAAVEEIITRCARLPLALATVAARAAAHPHLPLHTVAEELRDTNRCLNVLMTDDPHIDVRAVFSWSYQTLTADAARLFRLLSLHPGPDISCAAAASLAAVLPVQVRPLLAELVRANLIVEHTPARYTLHDLLRVYATEQAHNNDPDQQRHAATNRMLDHYLHTADAADQLLYPAADPLALTPPRPGVTPEGPVDHQQALNWFTTERLVLLAAVDHASATGWDTLTWQLAWTMRTFLYWRGHWHDQITAGRAALAAARRLADPSAQARAHRCLASACFRLGRSDEAHTYFRHALDLSGQAGDHLGQAQAHLNLAWMWGKQLRNAQALDNALQALDLCRAADHRRGQADAMNTVGWFHAQLGDHQQAIAVCQQALTLFQELGDRYGQADCYDSLGYAHHHLGHHDQALASYRQAIDLYRDLGDRYEEATTLAHLGDTHHATGNTQTARDTWQQALTILDELNHTDTDQIRAKLAALDPPNPDSPADRGTHHDDQ